MSPIESPSDRDAATRGDPLSRVGFGGGTMISQAFGPIDADAARGAVDAAYEAGIRFFDTAWFYGSGDSEKIIGEILDGRRENVRICTKGGVRYEDPSNLNTLVRDASVDGLRAGLHESLGRLRTDHVDVFLLHQQDLARSPEQQMENLAVLRDEGLAREVGFCNFGRDATAAAVATGIPTFVEFSLNLLDDRYVADLELAGSSGCTRITFGSFAHGLLSEDWEEDHVFEGDDWRGRSRTTGEAGTSGNVFFAGDAFARHVGIAKRLRGVADRLGVSLAALVVALTVRLPQSDIALLGCRNAGEVRDNTSGLGLELGPDAQAEVAEILAGLEKPSENLLGV